MFFLSVRPTCHAAGKAILSGSLPVGLAHPVTQLALHPVGRDGDRVSLVLGHNHSFTLHSGHIFWVRSRQPTVKKPRISQRKRFYLKAAVAAQVSPVLVFGKLFDHPVPLQAGQDVGGFLRRPRHHVDVGGFALVHRTLHKVGHRRRKRGDGGEGSNPDTRPDTSLPEKRTSLNTGQKLHPVHRL